MKRLLWLLIGVFVLLSTTPLEPTITRPQPALAQDMAAPYIEWQEKCKFETLFLPPDTETLGKTITCGILHTYEDPTNHASTHIQVAFAILKADNVHPLDDPIIYLEGGPGGSALFYIDPWVTSPLRAQRDIILVDQRGTGYSLPSLSCNTYIDAYFFAESEDIEACIDGMVANGVDLGNYNTNNNAHDIGELMTLLQPEMGYSAYNLLGISYGTRLGLAVMRDHPELVRSAILDSVYPQVVDHYSELAPNLQRAIEAMFMACERDAVCNAAYPELERVFYEVIADMGENYGESATTDFLNTIFAALYNKYRVQALPAAIYLYHEGNESDGDDLFYNGVPGSGGSYTDYYDSYDADIVDEYYDAFYDLNHADAFFMALECQEEFYFSSYEIAVATATDRNTNNVIATSQLFDVERMTEECPLWFDTPAPASSNERVYSDVPTLVVAGEFDPITPPEWAKVARETLNTSYYFSFPGEGHGVIDGHPCVTAVFAQFYANPYAEPDASCRAEMRADFYIHPDFE